MLDKNTNIIFRTQIDLNDCRMASVVAYWNTRDLGMPKGYGVTNEEAKLDLIMKTRIACNVK